jgi:hypothetical protein
MASQVTPQPPPAHQNSHRKPRPQRSPTTQLYRARALILRRHLCLTTTPPASSLLPSPAMCVLFPSPSISHGTVLSPKSPDLLHAQPRRNLPTSPAYSVRASSARAKPSSHCSESRVLCPQSSPRRLLLLRCRRVVPLRRRCSAPPPSISIPNEMSPCSSSLSLCPANRNEEA